MKNTKFMKQPEQIFHG